MDFIKSLFVLYIFFQIGNLTQWKICKKSSTVHLSVFLMSYSGLMLVISCILLIYNILDNYFHGSTVNTMEVGKTVDILETLVLRCGHIIYIVESVIHRNDEKDFIEQTLDIDHVIENELNVIIDYRKFKRERLFYGCISLVIYLSTFITMLTVDQIVIHEYTLTYQFLYFLPKIMCALRLYQLLTFIGIVKFRLGLLVKTTKEINLQNMISNSKDLEHADIKRLLIVRKIYSRIWKLNKTLNHGFRYSILAALMVYFLTIVVNCFWIFLNVANGGSRIDLKIFLRLLSIVPDVYSIILFSVTCEKAIAPVNDIRVTLHHIPIDLTNGNHHSLIEQFSLQLLHQDVKISAAGFFDINCSLIFKIIAACTTYFIIFIQFNIALTQTCYCYCSNGTVYEEV